MGIDLIIDYYADCENREEPHRVFEFRISDRTLVLERHGEFDHWDSISIRNGSGELYRLELDHRYRGHHDVGDRNEFFFGDFFRRYSGNQFSFVEYVLLAASNGEIPEPQRYLSLGLDENVEKQYRKQLKRMLNGT